VPSTLLRWRSLPTRHRPWDDVRDRARLSHPRARGGVRCRVRRSSGPSPGVFPSFQSKGGTAACNEGCLPSAQSKGVGFHNARFSGLNHAACPLAFYAPTGPLQALVGGSHRNAPSTEARASFAKYIFEHGEFPRCARASVPPTYDPPRATCTQSRLRWRGPRDHAISSSNTWVATHGPTIWRRPCLVNRLAAVGPCRSPSLTGHVRSVRGRSGHSTTRDRAQGRKSRTIFN